MQAGQLPLGSCVLPRCSGTTDTLSYGYRGTCNTAGACSTARTCSITGMSFCFMRPSRCHRGEKHRTRFFHVV